MTKKTKPFATIDTLHPGDTVWCSSQSMFTPIEEVEPRPYTVVEVNKTSFYVSPSERPNVRFRHSMKTGQCAHGTFGFIERTFKTKEEHIQLQQQIIKQQTLRRSLAHQINDMTLSELERLDAYIKK